MNIVQGYSSNKVQGWASNKVQGWASNKVQGWASILVQGWASNTVQVKQVIQFRLRQVTQFKVRANYTFQGWGKWNYILFLWLHSSTSMSMSNYTTPMMTEMVIGQYRDRFDWYEILCSIFVLILTIFLTFFSFHLH